jgi:hypothetical protein
MHCPRCHGLMIPFQMQEASSPGEAAGWRCLLCGETIDPGIEANRVSHCQPVRSRARVPGSPAARIGKGRL